MPKVSVIIPTHSRPHLLPRAVESAKNAGTDVEVIVVDDASTDETAEVCYHLKGIKYIRTERNQRVAGARNLGILASSAEYISFLDDDDVRLPNSLDIQVDVLQASPEAGLVYGQVFPGDENCVPQNQNPWPEACPQGDIFWELFRHNVIACQSVVFRKSALYRVGLLDKTIPGLDDWDIWLRIAELYPVIAIEQPVAVWRSSTPESGQGSSDWAVFYLRVAEVYRRIWQKLPRVAALPKEKQQQLWRDFADYTSDMMIWSAEYEIGNGRAEYARKCLHTALKINPKRAIRSFTFKVYLSSFLPNGNVPFSEK